MIGISRQGKVDNLCGGGHLVVSLFVQEYIGMYCDEGTEKVASHILVA